jgi:hypothetical protein
MFSAGDLRFNDTKAKTQVWSRPLSNGDAAAVLWNWSDWTPEAVSLAWSHLGWPLNSTVKLRDVWERRDLGVFSGGGFISPAIAPHDVLYLRATLVQ